MSDSSTAALFIAKEVGAHKLKHITLFRITFLAAEITSAFCNNLVRV